MAVWETARRKARPPDNFWLSAALSVKSSCAASVTGVSSLYARYWGRCSKRLAHCQSEKTSVQRPGETTHMTECHADLMLGLVDLTSVAFSDLMDLDESLVGGVLDRLLPPCAGAESRLWNQGGFSAARVDDQISD